MSLRPERTPMYLHLFHGRQPWDQQLDNWGVDGPVLIIEGFHCTYKDHIRVGVDDPYRDWFDLEFKEDLLYYNGTWYGDWSIFAKGTDPLLESRAEKFRADRAMMERADAEAPSVAEPIYKPLTEDEQAFAQDVPDEPSTEDLENMVNDLADVMEAHLAHGDANLSLWVEKARRMVDNWPEEKS